MNKYNYIISRLIHNLTTLLMITSCSLYTTSDLTTSRTSPQWIRHKKLLYTLNHYKILGSFVFISNQQKVYARFNWQQKKHNHYQLILTNLLGNTEIKLNVQSGIAQLINNKGKLYTSNNPDEIIYKMTGISIPVTALQHWILGLPEDSIEFEVDSRGYLKILTYEHIKQTWIVIYQGYHEEFIPALPSSLEMRQGQYRIKLKIDHWKIL